MNLRKIYQFLRKQAVWRFLTHPLSALFFVDLLVYGIFVPLLGFYWDDFNFYWFYLDSGNAGLEQYFAKDGPFMGLIYQLNFSILGNKPWHWQLFALFWRWACAAGIYFLIQQLWKKHREPAFITAMVFLVFPGFSQQFIAICYGHFHLALCTLVMSFALTLYVIDHPKFRLPLTFLALLLAFINLFSTEYFFALELLRPILIWIKVSDEDKRFKQQIIHVLKNWWPYLAVLFVAIFWRTVLFKYQTGTYSFTLLSTLTSHPWDGIKTLFNSVIRDTWMMIVTVWKNVFIFPTPTSFGKNATLLYVVITIALFYLLGFTIFSIKDHEKLEEKRLYHRSFLIILLGLLACLLAGVPFWSTGLQVSDTFPNDRFSLPFILGSGLIFTGILFLLPARPYLRRGLFIVLLSLAGGLQVRDGIIYKRDWENMQRFMLQLTWRVPAIEPGTIVFSNDLPLRYYSDLSLTAPLNLTYQQDSLTEQVPYLFYFPTTRKTDTTALTMTSDQPIHHDLTIGTFDGNTNRSFTLYYNPPDCLRIIDPEIESDNWMLPLYVRQTAALSNLNTQLIKSTPEPRLPDVIDENISGESWCYYFEKADLARQLQNWQEVAEIADQVLTGFEKPTDPIERLVYIEGYAHMENWQRALELTDTTLSVTGAMQPPLCKLWLRIKTQTPDSVSKSETLTQVEQLLKCEY